MPQVPEGRGKVDTVRAVFDLIRDGILLGLLLAVLLLPAKLNTILEEAGFVRASIFGFEWQARIDAAIQGTEEAIKEAERIETELRALVRGLDVPTPPTTQQAMSQRLVLAKSTLQGTRSAVEALSLRLGMNLLAQKSLREELSNRIKTLPPRRQ